MKGERVGGRVLFPHPALATSFGFFRETIHLVKAFDPRLVQIFRRHNRTYF